MLQLHRLLLAVSQYKGSHLAHLMHLSLQQQQQQRLCSTPKLALSQQQHARAASSKGRGGRKTPANVKGYDRLLSQWAHMTARPGSGNSSKDKAKRPHGECPAQSLNLAVWLTACWAVACAVACAALHCVSLNCVVL